VTPVEAVGSILLFALMWMHGFLCGRVSTKRRVLCPRCGVIVPDAWALGHHLTGCKRE